MHCHLPIHTLAFSLPLFHPSPIFVINCTEGKTKAVVNVRKSAAEFLAAKFFHSWHYGSITARLWFVINKTYFSL